MMKPCIKCGSTDRNKKGDCKACAKSRGAAWRVANAERLKERNATYYLEHQDIVKTRSAAYRSKYPDRVKALTAAWQKANPEKCNFRTSKWASSNKDKVRAKNAAWGIANRAKVTANTRRRRKENPEWARLQTQNRRSRLAGGVLSRNLSDRLFILQQGKCACCAQPLGAKYHLDHIMPLALGGSNTDDNIQLLRQRCNGQKGAKHPADFMRERGLLL